MHFPFGDSSHGLYLRAKESPPQSTNAAERRTLTQPILTVFEFGSGSPLPSSPMLAGSGC